MRLLPLVLTYSLAVTTSLLLPIDAHGDTFHLKGGEKIEGKLLKETDKEVTIEYRASASIVDTRIIAKADLEKVDREAPDAAAYLPLKNLNLGNNSLALPGYDSAMKSLQDFLNQFPQSTHAAEATQKLLDFTAERKRVESGEIKLAGKWISQEEAQRERYQLNAATVFAQMQEQGRRGDFIAALNTFESIEKNYPGAKIYPEAVGLAQQLLKQLPPAIDRALKTWQVQKKEREAGTNLAPEPRKSELIALQNREQQQLDAAFEAANKAGVKWPPFQARNERTLALLAGKVQPEQSRLETIPLAQLNKSIQLAEKARIEIAAGRVDVADQLISEALAAWAPNELAMRLQQESAAAKTAAANTKTPEPETPMEAPAEAPAATPAPANPVPVAVEENSAPVTLEEEEERGGFFSGIGGLLTLVVIAAGLGYLYISYKKKKRQADEEFE